ncbi:MAG: methyltransferase [Planctomycetota bacterium]|nr:methyltransferase [Planctomycetota bacterium]
METGRDVVLDALNHRQPSKVPVDFGGTSCSGMHCSVVAALRDHFGLEKRVVKIHEPFQMLGYIEEDLRQAMGVDATIAMPLSTMFGDDVAGDWKEWKTWWGQTVLIPSGMRVAATDDGGFVAYPQGDTLVPPCAKMPATGYFFDAVIRQEGFDEDELDPTDNTEEFTVLGESDLARIAAAAKAARDSGLAVVAGLPGTAFGDIAFVPGMSLKKPKGVRDVAEWYMSIAARPEFVHKVFDRQCEVAMENLKLLKARVGDNYDVVFVCGTDFGTQISTFCSLDALEELYLPYYGKINRWIHENTSWKTFKHSCGAIEPFIESLVGVGFDVLNPVQCSATGMDPRLLKDKYGSRLTFWGGGIDTQKTLPFGKPEEVRAQVLERCRIFNENGGFVFNAIHNVQAMTPTANMAALLDAITEFNTAGK